MFEIAEYIGIIAFSMSGFFVAAKNKLYLLGVLVITFLTALGGGIARDVIINEVPFVLKTGFYGTVSILIAITLYLLHILNQTTYTNIALLFFAALTLRLIAYYAKWSIPLK